MTQKVVGIFLFKKSHSFGRNVSLAELKFGLCFISSVGTFGLQERLCCVNSR